MTSVDNPLNGYTEDEYIGTFLLSPRIITARNTPQPYRQAFYDSNTFDISRYEDDID